jgi:4-aminobutyrate aminotransferase-like enzyme
MNTRETLDLLRCYESRNVTFIEPDGSWPIVWRRAKGVHVWDADGKKYLDLTAAFGVANAGHANPYVVRAGQEQMSSLLHAMGDVHPHSLKAELARELSRVTFERWTQSAKRTGKTIFCNSGFEAVEAGLKTAFLATGKPGVIAFEGAYHGLGYGALNATHRDHFRSPFREQLREFASFVPFPTDSPVNPWDRSDFSNSTPLPLRALETAMEREFRTKAIGAVLVEPIQVRGGINIPPPGFLPILRRVCDQHQAVLIFDEIYTGFARTGKWFACEHWQSIPDLICLGKALTGGFPLSACVGRADLMDSAWPVGTGEAIHTSTFLGHPTGCAMALAQIAEIKRLKLVERSENLGQVLVSELTQIVQKRTDLRLLARGIGLLAGVELRTQDGTPATGLSIALIKQMLRSGFILLPEGEHSNIISFTPPLTISERQLRSTTSAFRKGFDAISRKKT